MSKTISVHSFRGGTGKSNTTANLATILAAEGRCVGVIDTDIQSPGIHVLFNLNEDDIEYSLNDYLWGKCDIRETACNVTESLKKDGDIKGQVFLVPSSIKASEITRILHEGYDVSLLSDGYRTLIHALNLDALLIDTHPGLNEETLLSIAITDVLAILMRPDQQDYQGTGVTVEVARELGVPRLLLIVNQAPSDLDLNAVRLRVEQTYNCEVAAVLPHSQEMLSLASSGIFVLRYPDHPITKLYKQIAEKLCS